MRPVVVPDPVPEITLTAPFRQGDTWNSPVFTHTDQADDPIDFTGFELRMTLRANPQTEPVLVLDSADGTIVIVDADAGQWRPQVGSDVTAALSILGVDQPYFFEVKMYNAASPPYFNTILCGQIIVKP